MNIKERINGLSKKDVFRGISALLIIILVLIFNGFMSFITVGFDFSKLSTAEYWANFALLLASEMAVMFGMYLIQKSRDLKNEKITDVQKTIENKRNTVYFLDKVAEAEEWLRDVYNYQEKLNLYENKVKSQYEKLKLIEPSESDKNYIKKKKKFDKKKEQKDKLLKQLSYIKIDRQRISYIIAKNLVEAEKLAKELDTDEYLFKSTKIHYKPIYWGNLLADVEETRLKPTSAFFSEKLELTKNITKYVAFGLISASFLSCLIFPTFNSLGWNTVVSLLANLVILLVFMTRGIGLSHKIILDKYYKALESRKSIYVKMLRDLGISKVVIEDEGEE